MYNQVDKIGMAFHWEKESKGLGPTGCPQDRHLYAAN